MWMKSDPNSSQPLPKNSSSQLSELFSGAFLCFSSGGCTSFLNAVFVAAKRKKSPKKSGFLQHLHLHWSGESFFFALHDRAGEKGKMSNFISGVYFQTWISPSVYFRTAYRNRDFKESESTVFFSSFSSLKQSQNAEVTRLCAQS